MNDIEEVGGKKVERALLRVKRYERESRMLFKRSEEYDVLEEVFDRPTLFTLYALMNSHLFEYLNGVVNSGKESRVYWGVRRDGSNVAVKIYLTVAAEFRRRMIYIAGDPRFKHVKKGIRNLVNLWARKEYQNLLTAIGAGVPCPKPYVVKNNVLVMDFLGDDGRPAPLLGEVEVGAADYRRVLSIVRRLYRKARLVHADLSEFNIFSDRGRLILFDLGSAVDLAHPNAHEFLVRDITNINRFFEKRGVEVLPLTEALRRVVGHKL